MDMYPDNQELTLNGEKVMWPGVDASGKFTNGAFDNPLVPPSFIPAETINLILDNLAGLVKRSGIKPDNISSTQLAQALDKRLISLLEYTNIGASALVDESKCRNLLDVLGIRSVHSDEPASKNELQRAMKLLHDKINADGQADWRDLRLGDYLDLPELHDGQITYKWSGEYKNLRIMISAFNMYKSAGYSENIKNHIVFTFRNCVLTRQMNDSNTNIGGYSASKLSAYLDGGFKTGMEAILGKYLYTINRLLSKKGYFEWQYQTVFLPTEREVWGSCVWSEKYYDGGFQCQYPIFRDSALYKVKRYNGSRIWWWTSSPHDGDTSSFCNCPSFGHPGTYIASGFGGIAPAFCVM